MKGEEGEEYGKKERHLEKFSKLSETRLLNNFKDYKIVFFNKLVICTLPAGFSIW